MSRIPAPAASMLVINDHGSVVPGEPTTTRLLTISLPSADCMVTPLEFSVGVQSSGCSHRKWLPLRLMKAGRTKGGAGVVAAALLVSEDAAAIGAAGAEYSEPDFEHPQRTPAESETAANRIANRIAISSKMTMTPSYAAIVKAP